MTWLNKVKKPKPTELVKVVVRPKGLILKGKDWDAFSWNDAKQTTQVLNAMSKALVSTEPVPVIILNPGTDGKCKCSLGESTNVWTQTDQGFVSSLANWADSSDMDEPDELF